LLHKALYGLKQASREWYLKLREQLEGLGFKRSDADHRVFTKIIDGKLFVIAIYIDNFLLFSGRIDDIKAIKRELSKHFEMKDLGEAKWILQMKIKRTDMDRDVRKLTISQEQYVEMILEQHGIADCKLAKTPMAANQQLPMLTEAEVNITDYQRCIGSLIQLAYCHGMLLVLEKLTCRLSNAFFAISVEPAITSSNSKATTRLPHHSRHSSILTGQEIGWTGSPSLVLSCWTKGQYLGDQRSRHQFLRPRWKPNL